MKRRTRNILLASISSIATTCCLYAQEPATGAQKPPAAAVAVTPSILSSRAAYDEAMRPLDLTRRDLGNWSDVEVAALNLAIQQAASACALRDPLSDAVNDLVDLARLCGVGQNWNGTMLAANRYISAVQPDKPQLTQAYADSVEAELHLHLSAAALKTAQEMLAKVPYDAIASGAFNQAVDYLEFSDTAAALQLTNSAQPILLRQLAALSSRPAASAGATDATILTAVQAYRDALRLPELEVYLGHLELAATLANSVEAALPLSLTGDDVLLIAAERRRYALLGHRLPPIDVGLALDPERAPALELPIPGLTTALLVFPDWCAQCVRMGPQFPVGKFSVGGRDAVFYALLAQTRPTSAATAISTGKSTAPDPFTQLEKTPTLLVTAGTLLQLEGSNYPLLVLVDEHGIVRLHQSVGEDALQSGNTLDSALAGLPVTGPYPSVRPLHAAPSSPPGAR